MKERPTAIKDRLSQFLRDIDRREICCAKCRHEQDELEVGHVGILNIERRHGHPLSGVRSGESTQNVHTDEGTTDMVTIVLTGQLHTMDGECDLACEIDRSMSVRQLIQRQGAQLRHLLQLLREKKVLVTINKKIASEDSLVQDGDAIRLIGHDGMGGSGLGPSHP